MAQVTIIGLDLATNVFQAHGASETGQVVFRKKLTRNQVLSFLSEQPRCIIAMEACATAHGWAREIGRLGHSSRLIPPQYVKAYVKRQKNDMADAEAIAEAASRPTMRLVEVKSEDQQASAMAYRTRQMFIGQRTQSINALRSHLAEHGVIAATNKSGQKKLSAMIEDETVGIDGTAIIAGVRFIPACAGNATPPRRRPPPNARPKRPRLDHFLAHMLVAETGQKISIRELYAEYRDFAVPKGRPRFENVEDELKLLERYAISPRPRLTDIRGGRRISDQLLSCSD